MKYIPTIAKLIFSSKQLRLLITVFLLLINMNVFAQFTGNNFTKSSASPLTGNTVVTASEEISMLDGFETNGHDLDAYISNAASCVLLASSPSQNQNYIINYTVKEAGITNPADPNNTVCQVNQTIQYFDGLGRPLQIVQTKGSPSLQDIVQPRTYDEFGREAKKYLSYTSTVNNGSYKPDALEPGAGVFSFYNPSGSNGTQLPGGIARIPTPFAETKFEPSPLNRVAQQGSPGDAWQLANGHVQRMEYQSNTAADAVQLWNITASGADATNSYYQVSQLFKTINKDENWVEGQPFPQAGTIEEFKDKEAKVVLKRTFNHNTTNNTLEALSTYYVYDNFGNLRYVIPPAVTVTSFTEAVSDAAFNRYVYAYHYDGRNRVTEKKSSGKGWEELIYNTLNQIVLSRDAIQQGQGKWMFNKYDALGRVICTGIFTSGSDRSTLQAEIDTQPLYETRADGSDYPNTAFPTTDTEYLTVNYYDDYSFNQPGYTFANHTYNLQKTERTKGFLTGSKVKILGSSQFLYTVNYYDEDATLIQTFTENHLQNGIDRIDNKYSFAGELTHSTRIHSSSGGNVTIANRYVYDHMGRKKQTFQNTGDASSTEVLLSEFDYNEIGQVKEKKLQNSQQSTIYSYNSRGWLKSSISGQFSMTLNYEDAVGTTAQYNGNISNQIYINSNSNTFNYTYDKLNRLSNASASGLSESIDYDPMGNIRHLSRDGYGTNDYHTYDGNRLMGISGFTNSSYGYDVNGNMNTDSQKGISIGYNLLNLPQNINGSKIINYSYDATGNKLKMQSITTGITTDYIKGIQYTNGAIEFIQTEEGIARRNGSTYRYEYNLKDHLGNTRATFYRNPTSQQLEVLQRDNYFAFGLQKSVQGSTNHYLYNGKELQEETRMYDYGFRHYDPVVGRWIAPDLLAEFAYNLTPYRYCFNNPVGFTDPYGLWETTDGGYKTNKKEDIERFISMMSMEKSIQKKDPDISQIASFVSGEMAGGGKLSDGTRLANGFSVTAYRQVGGGIRAYADKQSFSNFWHGIQKDLNPDVLDTRTLNKQFWGLFGNLSYPGGNNPKTYRGDDDFSYKPTNPAEYPGITHDHGYTDLGIEGASGLFTSRAAIGLDWRFVASEVAISNDPRVSVVNRLQARIVAIGLGTAATPKTIYDLGCKTATVMSLVGQATLATGMLVR